MLSSQCMFTCDLVHVCLCVQLYVWMHVFYVFMYACMYTNVEPHVLIFKLESDKHLLSIKVHWRRRYSIQIFAYNRILKQGIISRLVPAIKTQEVHIKECSRARTRAWERERVGERLKDRRRDKQSDRQSNRRRNSKQERDSLKESARASEKEHL